MTSSKLHTLKQQLNLLQNPHEAQKMSAYMRQHFSFYGIPATKRRDCFKPFLQADKKEKQIDWEFLNQAWCEEEREMQYFVLDYIRSLKTYLTTEDLEKLEKFARDKQWWDSIDHLARTIGYLVIKEPQLKNTMLTWAQDTDFWIRRIAILHQLGYKDKTDPILLEKILSRNLGSDQFFINKAIGWALRDYSKSHPNWVSDFLGRYQDQLAPLSIREASKYL